MKAYEYLEKAHLDAFRKEHQRPKWRYHGPGYGQGVLHFIGLLDPQEVVTCSVSHGWLGSCEDFIKQFELVK